MKKKIFLTLMTFLTLGILAKNFLEPETSSFKWINNVSPDELIIEKTSSDDEVHFVKFGEKWVLNFPNGYNIEKIKLDKLLKSLKTIKPIDSFKPLEDDQDYGFGEKEIKMTTRGDFEESIIFLGISKDLKKSYLKFKGEEEVHLIPMNFYESVKGDKEDWVDKRLAKINPEEIKGISVHINTKDFKIPNIDVFGKIVLWDLRRTQGREWRELGKDLPVSSMAVKNLIHRIRNTEGYELNHRDFLGDPAIKISIEKYEEKIPLEIMIDPHEGYWASWGDSFGGFYMDEKWDPELMIHSGNSIYREKFLEIEEWEEYEITTPNGSKLLKKENEDTENPWAKIFNQPWPEETKPANTTKLTEKKSIKIKWPKEKIELDIFFYPVEKIIRFSEFGIMWEFPEYWWEQNKEVFND